MRRPASRILGDRRGAAAIEFSFIAPVLILMMAGVYEIGRIFQSQSAANKIGTQYAIAYADCVDLPAGACNTELSLYGTSNALKNLAPELTNTATLQMFQVVMNGSSPTVSYAYPNGSTLTSAQTTAASTVLTNGQTGVIVTVNYSYTMDLFPLELPGVPHTVPFTYTVVQLKA